MVSRNAGSDYETALKILSMLECSKPVALVTISQATGVKLADIIRYCNQLISEKIIERTVDNGNLFYILRTEEYEDKVASIFNASSKEPAPQKKKTINSREEIMKRRSRRTSGIHETVSSEMNPSVSKNSTEISGTRRSAGPERITALDLLAMKRSSATLNRVVDTGRSSSRLAALSSTGINQQQSRDIHTSSSTLFSQTGSHPSITERRISSTAQKAVYINKPTSRKSDMRSSFNNMIPTSSMEQAFLERSDTNFKQTNPAAGRIQMPLIPNHALVSNNTEIPESEVREALLIRKDTPLITILSPRPCHDIWSACSALANTCGGYIVLGLRKYKKDDNVTYYIKSVANPPDAIKNILKGFNDRNIISDCPKDHSFITSMQLRKKNIIVIHIDPSMFSPAPLYTARDSFGMKTNQGCYIYIDDEIIHCTQEDVKALWQQRRLGKDTPDWDQSSEQLNVTLERRMKLHMPVQIDDAVRPLSRKIDTYGQPLENIKYTPHIPNKCPESDLYEGERILASTGFAKSTDKKRRPSEYRKQNEEMSMPMSISRTTGRRPIEGTVESILFAEDINVPDKSCLNKHSKNTVRKSLDDPDVRKTKTPVEQEDKPKKPKKSTGQKSAATKALQSHRAIQKSFEDLQPKTPRTEESQHISLPLAKDADQDIFAPITEPLIEHPRLPMARVAEIAASLCSYARFTMPELARVLHKKLPPVRDKVMPKLRENPNFVEEDGVFYIKS